MIAIRMNLKKTSAGCKSLYSFVNCKKYPKYVDNCKNCYTKLFEKKILGSRFLKYFFLNRKETSNMFSFVMQHAAILLNYIK